MNSSATTVVGVLAMLLAYQVLPCVAQTGLLDGRVTVADSAGLNPPDDFTLEAWIKPTLFHFDGDVANSYQQVIHKWSGGGDNQRSYLLGMFQDQVEFAMTPDGTSESSDGIYSNVHLALNQWVHIAGVYSEGTMALFVTGEKDPQTLWLPEGPFPGQAPVYVGAATDTRRFHGVIDEVRISYVARYFDDFIVPAVEFFPDSATMLLMHLNEGAGTYTDNVGLLCGDGTLDALSGWAEGAPLMQLQPGDLNCDGVVNFRDINPFVLAFTNWGAYLQQYPDCDIYLADINGDGYVSFTDINPFVMLLSGN